MKNKTLSLLCACAYFSFSPLHATRVEDELLKGIDHYYRTEVSGYINPLGDDMRQAILSADFPPCLRHQVIKIAYNTTPQKIPLLGRVLAPFSKTIMSGDLFEKLTRLPDTMLQALADTPLPGYPLILTLERVDLVTPAHIAPLSAFFEGMDRVIMDNYNGSQFSRIIAKTPDEIAAVAALGLSPGYRMAVLENMSLFPEEKRPALRRLLAGQAHFNGLKTLQAALPHDAQTLTKYADEGFEPYQRAILLGTNILDLPPEHLSLAKRFLCGMRFERDIKQGADKVISSSQEDLERVLTADFSPRDRCDVLEFIQSLSQEQLPPLKRLLDCKPNKFVEHDFRPSLLVQGIATQKHTPMTMDTLCDPFFERNSAAIILNQPAACVDQKIILLKELLSIRKSIHEFDQDITIHFMAGSSVDQLQMMLDCARIIAQTPMEQYKKLSFLYKIEVLRSDQIVPIATLLTNVPHHLTRETREFIGRAAKLSNERLEHIAKAGFHPIHIDFIMQHLGDIDPAHYPWVKRELSEVSVLYQGVRTGRTDLAVRNIRKKFDEISLPGSSSSAQSAA